MPKMFFRKFTGTYYVTIKRRQFNLGRDKKKAEATYHKLLSANRLPSLDGPVTVLIDRFLEWAERNRAEGTYRWYKEVLDSFKQSIGDTLKVDDFKPYHVSTWIDTRYANTSDSYRHNLIRGVQRAFNWSVKQGYLDRSPVQHIEKPQQTAREVFINATQWKTLLKLIPDQEFKDLLTILWETGCRPLEARTMAAKHIQNSRAVFERINSKGKKIQRTIYFNAKAMAIVKCLCNLYPTGPLLRNLRGEPWTKDAVVSRFQRMELPFDVTAYALRHSWATRAVESGKLTDIEVAMLMGHKDTRMLETVYQHVNDKHLQRAVRKLD